MTQPPSNLWVLRNAVIFLHTGWESRQVFRINDFNKDVPLKPSALIAAFSLSVFTAITSKTHLHTDIFFSINYQTLV